MIVLGVLGLGVGGRQSFAAMVERVERRQIAHGVPRLGLQIDGGANLLEVTLHLQQAVHDERQTGKALEQDLYIFIYITYVGGNIAKSININESKYMQPGREAYVDWQEGVFLFGNSQVCAVCKQFSIKNYNAQLLIYLWGQFVNLRWAAE